MGKALRKKKKILKILERQIGDYTDVLRIMERGGSNPENDFKENLDDCEALKSAYVIVSRMPEGEFACPLDYEKEKKKNTEKFNKRNRRD